MQKFFKVGGRVVTASLAMALVAQQTYAVGLADIAASIDAVDILAGLTAIALLIGLVRAGRMGIRNVLGLIK